MEKAYTPLSLVDFCEFRKLISSLDPRIFHVLRSRLSRKLIPLKYESVYSDVINGLNNCPYGVLRFDLWMSVKNRDIFQYPYIIARNLKKGTTTLACPAQKVHTQRTFLNLSLKLLLSLILRAKLLASPVMVKII